MQKSLSLFGALVVFFNFTFLPQTLIAQCECGTVCSCPDCPFERKDRQGAWFVVETANFQVCCNESIEPATHLARHAESLRSALRSKWLGGESAGRWNPRCQIVLYPNKRRYIAAVGRGSERTVGSSLVNIDQGRITKRRIDLLGGQSQYLSAALPHELTHVVLQDRFVSVPLPRWADEGIAILADPQAKQGRHFKDLRDSFMRSTTFHTASLLTLGEYPRADRVGAFYGQSASLAQYLVSRENPQKLVEFVEQANDMGFDEALRQCYGIAGMAELDRLWRRHVQTVQLASFQVE